MTGKYHAYILQIDGALKVRPAVASLDRATSVDEHGHVVFTIRNLTAHEAKLWLAFPLPIAKAHVQVPPTGGVTPPIIATSVADTAVPPSPVVIPAGTVRSVDVPDGVSGVCRYAVTFELRGEGVVHAAGESDPVVIVDP
jgi:hypothetical protein